MVISNFNLPFDLRNDLVVSNTTFQHVDAA